MSGATLSNARIENPARLVPLTGDLGWSTEFWPHFGMDVRGEMLAVSDEYRAT